MSNEMFVPVGTIIIKENKQLKVVEQFENLPRCTGCYFSDTNRERLGLSKFSCHVLKLPCTASCRQDNKHIIFKEV